MKRFILAAVVLSVFGLAVGNAEEAGTPAESPVKAEMMKKQGGPKPDERTELKIPAPMKVMQKGMMRNHMDTLSEITAALAANDLSKAAEIAKGKLGWSREEERRCSMVEKITGEADFMKLGKAVHMKADELAEAAKAGNRDKALQNLAELITSCNACHNRFRH